MACGVCLFFKGGQIRVFLGLLDHLGESLVLLFERAHSFLPDFLRRDGGILGLGLDCGIDRAGGLGVSLGGHDPIDGIARDLGALDLAHGIAEGQPCDAQATGHASREDPRFDEIASLL